GLTIALAGARLRPDVVHAHDVAMLPSGWLAARLARAHLVYDTHEYAAGVPYRTRAFRVLVTIVERLFVPRADAVVTVSDGAAGVPVVASDLPELRKLIERYRIGWLVDPADPAAVADGIATALAARGDAGLRDALAAAARELSWSAERPRLLEVYAELE